MWIALVWGKIVPFEDYLDQTRFLSNIVEHVTCLCLKAVKTQMILQ